MAVRQAKLMFQALAVSTLTVTPRFGESFMVTEIYTLNPSGGTQHVTIINDTARVGFFRISGLGGRHLCPPNDANRGTNMLYLMRTLFGFKGYPVVSGEALTINIDTGTADIFVVADSLDLNDVKSSDQGGSKSTDQFYVNYGTNLSNIIATGYNKLDNRRNPAEMPAFPFGAPAAALVPALRKVHIYLIGGQACGRFVSAGNTANTKFLRLRTGQTPGQTILDRADVGYPFVGVTPGSGTDYTSSEQVLYSAGDLSGFQDNLDARSPIPPLDFNANDELALQVNTNVVAAGQLNAGDIDVWTLQRLYPA